MKQRLTIDKILEKEFHIDYQGYNALEVDSFLDEVMQDYEMFETLIKKQKELLDRYENALAEQKRKQHVTQGLERAQSGIEPQPSYVDLLRRISKLEEVVYKK
ncbi:MAG: DivIVA domain-containing protein [Erysipelothrix sp.]|nr:DivIVA domain-containing protein [Erysipelothrix sp.]